MRHNKTYEITDLCFSTNMSIPAEDQMHRMFDERKDSYAGALLRYSIAKYANSWMIGGAIMQFVHATQTLPEEQRLDYESLRLGVVQLSLSDAWETVTLAAEKKTFSPLGLPEIPLAGSFQGVGDGSSFLRSSYEYGGFIPDWPCDFFLISGRDSISSSLRPIVEQGLPAYPDIYVATRDVVRIPRQSVFFGRLGVILPRFTGRLTRVVVESRKRFSVLVDSLEGGTSGLMLKSCSVDDRGLVEHSDVRLQDGVGQVNLQHPMSESWIYLITESGELVDGVDLAPGYYGRYANVVYKVPEDLVQSMTRQGEGEHLEFKSEVSEEFYETVIAFANGDGGTILLGIGDHGEVVGCSRRREEIDNGIMSSCEPRIPGIEVEVVEIGRIPIMMIKVPKGSNPPYIRKGRGTIFLRHGATDVLASRADLDELTKKH